jgi:two-component system, cell cycle sensor histidine kinase and response regulator CckA
MAVRCLRKLGYAVAEAGTGPEALAVWAREKGEFDLLLTDMVMPDGMSGPDLAARLSEKRPHLRTIIASGHSERLAGLDRGTAPALDFLAKPYDVTALGAMVRACLDRKC